MRARVCVLVFCCGCSFTLFSFRRFCFAPIFREAFAGSTTSSLVFQYSEFLRQRDPTKKDVKPDRRTTESEPHRISELERRKIKIRLVVGTIYICDRPDTRCSAVHTRRRRWEHVLAFRLELIDASGQVAVASVGTAYG